MKNKKQVSDILADLKAVDPEMLKEFLEARKKQLAKKPFEGLKPS